MLCIAGTSCMDREAVKQKIRATTETVKAIKGTDSATESEDAVGPKYSSARKKALDHENAWYLKDFRMEVNFTMAGGKGQDLIQKSGNVFYLRRIASGRQLETLTLLQDGKWVAYLIKPSAKQAQRQKAHEGDFGEVFRKTYAGEMGMILSDKEKKKEKDKNGFIMQQTTEEIEVSHERMNGFDCEVTTATVRTESQTNPAMKMLDGVFGGELSKGLDEITKQAGNTTQVSSLWIDKESGAVVKKTYKVEGGEGSLMQLAQQTNIQFTVKSLTFNPDPNLIPNSLEGYTLVN